MTGAFLFARILYTTSMTFFKYYIIVIITVAAIIGIAVSVPEKSILAATSTATTTPDDTGGHNDDTGGTKDDTGGHKDDGSTKTGGQTSDRGAYKPLINPITGKTYSGDSYALVTGVVNNVIKATLGLSGVFALIAFIWGGITWMTSYGDPAKVTKGRTMMTWAVIGLIVIFGSFAIVNYLLDALQVGNSAPVSTSGDTTSSGLKGPTQ